MGQNITVAQVPSTDSSTHVFSLNRSLTGMEIFTYNDQSEIPEDQDPANILAKRILGKDVDSVSIYSNVVTINCDPEKFSKIKDDLTSIMENLFIFYKENQS